MAYSCSKFKPKDVSRMSHTVDKRQAINNQLKMVYKPSYNIENLSILVANQVRQKWASLNTESS